MKLVEIIMCFRLLGRGNVVCRISIPNCTASLDVFVEITFLLSLPDFKP